MKFVELKEEVDEEEGVTGFYPIVLMVDIIEASSTQILFQRQALPGACKLRQC